MNDNDLVALTLPDQYVKKYRFEKPNLNVSKEDIVKEGFLAEGSFGTVSISTIRIKNKDIVHEIKFAIKEAKGDENELRQEIQMYNEINHDFIIKNVGFCKFNNKLNIILEYAEYGKINDYLRQKKESVCMDKVLKFCYQIASAMAYMHEQQLVHRDLAARNIIVFDTDLCKLIDFGMSRVLNEKSTYPQYHAMSQSNSPNLRWTPPDAIRNQIYDEYSDSWSYGIVIWELTSYGDYPYGQMDDNQIRDYLQSENRLGKFKQN